MGSLQENVLFKQPLSPVSGALVLAFVYVSCWHTGCVCVSVIASPGCSHLSCIDFPVNSDTALDSLLNNTYISMFLFF